MHEVYIYASLYIYALKSLVTSNYTIMTHDTWFPVFCEQCCEYIDITS